MSETELSKLIEKYKNGTLTEEESAFLNAWYLKYAVEQESSFDPAYLDQNLDLVWNAIEDNVAHHEFHLFSLKRPDVQPMSLMSSPLSNA